MKNLKQLISVTFAIAILGFVFGSCSSSKTIDQAKLEGYWSLKTLNDQTATSVFKGAIPSIKFETEKKMVSGNAGCNRYFGGYTLEGNLFTAGNLGATQMMCIEENKESEFLKTIGTKGLEIAVNDDKLTFSSNKKVVLEFLKGDEPLAVNANNLTGTWVLEQIEGADASTLFSERPATFTFGENNLVTGNAGCNNYRATASFGAGFLKLGPIMGTKMACPQLEGEGKFTSILSKIFQSKIVGQKLIITLDGAEALVFVKQ